MEAACIYPCTARNGISDSQVAHFDKPFATTPSTQISSPPFSAIFPPSQDAHDRVPRSQVDVPQRLFPQASPQYTSTLAVDLRPASDCRMTVAQSAEAVAVCALACSATRLDQNPFECHAFHLLFPKQFVCKSVVYFSFRSNEYLAGSQIGGELCFIYVSLLL